jgi:hypothetical protein
MGMVSNAKWEAARARLAAAESELRSARAEMDRLKDLQGISYAKARAEVIRAWCQAVRLYSDALKEYTRLLKFRDLE